jgi:hypothetical protein
LCLPPSISSNEYHASGTSPSDVRVGMAPCIRLSNDPFLTLSQRYASCTSSTFEGSVSTFEVQNLQRDWVPPCAGPRADHTVRPDFDGVTPRRHRESNCLPHWRFSDPDLIDEDSPSDVGDTGEYGSLTSYFDHGLTGRYRRAHSASVAEGCHRTGPWGNRQGSRIASLLVLSD